MKYNSTYNVKIYVGLTEGYDGTTHELREIETLCKDYCSDIGYCVTVTPTKFVYKDGEENGAIIGLINYPRFPQSELEIRSHAFTLAKLCLYKFKQFRISVECTDNTYLIEREE